jgi:8-oxo-dGTP diphosphatase
LLPTTHRQQLEAALVTTITLAVGVVVLRGDSVLLIQRSKPPFAGAWSLPGGRVQPGETLCAAATREVLEETGLSVAIQGLIDVVDLIEPNADGTIAQQFALIDYWAEIAYGDLSAGDDAQDARWWPLAALPELGLWAETLRVITLATQARARASFGEVA